MKIEHIALWVSDLEAMKLFYTLYFNATSNRRYENEKKQFSSYFLSFEEGCRLELMHHPDVKIGEQTGLVSGLVHFALSLGSRAAVDSLTQRLRADGFTVQGEPRTTGDGYYESVVLDPEGNQIELTV